MSFEYSSSARVAISALAATGVMAVGACSSPEAPPPQAAPSAASAPTAKGCVEGPMRDSTITAADRAPFALFGSATYERDPAKAVERQVGSISLQNHKVVVHMTEALPAQPQRLFDTIGQYPYIGCSLGGVDEVKVMLTNGPDNGHFSGKYNTDPNTASIELSESNNPAARMFLTEASVISSISHELTHNRYEEWVDASATNHTVSEALDHLRSLYVADVQVAAEDFRATHGPAVAQTLRQLSAQYRKKGYGDEALATSLMADAFENDISTYALLEADSPLVSANTIEEMVLTMAERFGTPLAHEDKNKNYIGLQRKNIDLSGLIGADKQYKDFLESQYKTSDESACLEGADDARAGGPYGSLDEWVASTTTCDLGNPQYAVNNIRALPAARQKLAIEGRKWLVTLFTLTDPKVVPFLHTPQVLKSVA